MFGVLAVYQAMLPLLRESSDARIVNVSSAVGSLTPETRTQPIPLTRCSARSTRVQGGSQRNHARNDGRTRVSRDQGQPGFPGASPRQLSTDMRGRSLSRRVPAKVVRVALLGPDGPTGTFTRWAMHQFLGDAVSRQCRSSDLMLCRIA